MMLDEPYVGATWGEKYIDLRTQAAAIRVMALVALEDGRDAWSADGDLDRAIGRAEELARLADDLIAVTECARDAVRKREKETGA